MREYFRNLKTHPGLGVAFFMSIMGVLAALSNKSFSLKTSIIVGGVVTCVFFGMVLISNFKRK